MSETAIILFNDQGLETAARLKSLIPQSEIFGLKGRVGECDKSFSKTPETIQRLAADGVTIIGLCAAGILIRALAPILSDKRAEPPVVALADDGSVAVPLLGGLTGANELARKIAEAFGGSAAITASGSRRFGLQLEAPEDGYMLANPEDAKRVTSDILAGASVRLEGRNQWLEESALPIAEHGDVILRTSPYNDPPPQDGLLYHPKSAVVAIDDPYEGAPQDIDPFLKEMRLSPASIAAIILPEGEAAPEPLKRLAAEWKAQIRYAVAPSTFPGVSIHSEHVDGNAPISVGIADHPIDVTRIGRGRGLVSIAGLGPGDAGSMSGDVRQALFDADDLVGYETYLNLVPPGKSGQKRHSSGNRVEIERSRDALDLAAKGRHVAVVSSGDPGIFAMAAAIMEAYEASPERWPGIDIEILPGISAMQTAAARFGAPLGHDFCAISLSDIRKPWATIEKRLTAAADADFVIALYNPASKDRREQIDQAVSLLLERRDRETPVLLGQNLGRDGERTVVTTLGGLDTDIVDMRTIVIVGSSQTRAVEGPSGKVYAYTPRSYGRD